MIFFKLFLVFLEIGAVSFGGGYGMISLISEKVAENDWLTETEFLNFIAVSESTPGPLAVNMATFIGSSQAGFFGALCATFGVVLPSFIIILLIAAVLRSLMKHPAAEAFLSGVRPCVVGMITATGIYMFCSVIAGIGSIHGTPAPDIRGGLIFAAAAAASVIYEKLLHKKLSPILLIIVSAVLGAVMFRTA